MSGLEGCTVFFLGFYKSLVKVKSDVSRLGGTVASLLGPAVTHLITTEYELISSTVEKAQSYEAYILSEEWVFDCISNQQRMPESNYFLGDVQPSSVQLKTKTKQKPATFSGFVASPLKVQPQYSYTDELKHEDNQSDENTDLPDWVPFVTNKKVKSKTIKINQPQPVNFAPNFPIIGQVTLQLSNLGNNNNKYYALELHKDTKASGLQFRIFVHYGRTCDLENNPNAGQKCYRYFSSLQEARISFQNLYDEKTKKGYTPLKLLSSNIGSDAAKKIRLASLNKSKPSNSSSQNVESNLHPEIQRLVTEFYNEASKAITASVNAKITPHGIETALGVLSKRQVTAGEDILLNIKSVLDNGGNIKTLTDLSSKFYTLIPHRIGRGASALRESVIDSMHKLEQKSELLQLMSDMLELIGAGGVGNVVDMQYKALKNSIIPLERNSNLWNNAENFILSTQTTPTTTIDIKNIFALSRPQEQLNTQMGNIQVQFHGSRACNFVGLLSRGLLMPKIVVSRGGGRTDAGLLGNGIYFSDSVTTASQYAYPSCSGSRFILANRVCLGRSKDYIETQIGLEKPPFGYHSVHGVSKSVNPRSVFKDEEYVVFETNQQAQEYLIEFDFIESSTRVSNYQKITPDSLPSSLFDDSSDSMTYDVVSSIPVIEQSYSHETPSFISSFNAPTIAKSTLSFQPQYQTIQPSSTGSRNEEPLSALPTSTTVSPQSNDEIARIEEKYRKLFATNPNNHEIRSPYVNLIDIMSNIPSFAYQSQTNEESNIPTLLTKYCDKNSSGLSVCRTKETFFENWNAFTESQFKGLNWSNLFVAGGAVLACLQPDFSTSIEIGNPYHSSDIDIFIYGLSTFEATEKLKHIYQVVKSNTNCTALIRSQHAVTILGEYPYRHSQIILRVYKSPAEVLMGFDIDACGVGFDGSNVYALPRARRALTKRYNLVDLSRRSLTYEIRLHKYSSRGFAVKVPELNWNSVNENLYQRSITEVTGLAKLLIFHNMQTKGVVCTKKSVKGVLKPKKGEDSDYANISLPWGPNWFISQIINSINTKNTASKFNPSSTAEHIFVTDIDGVLNGYSTHSCLCQTCKSGNPPHSDNISGTLRWVTENPGRQILTGSFHPVQDNQWWTDAYAFYSTIPGAFFRKISSKKSKPTKTTKKKVGFTPEKKMSVKPPPQTIVTAAKKKPSFSWQPPKTISAPQSSFASPQFGFVPKNTQFMETLQPESDTSKLLLLVSQLAKDGSLSPVEKSEIKDLIIRRNSTIISALEVYEIDRDLDELADSLQRICKLAKQ